MPTFRRPLLHIRRMGTFFRHLHELTRAGISIASACDQLSHRAPGRLRGLAAEMAAEAAAGQSISAVMERHPDLFYPWHIGLVRAAQAGGYLPEAFEQIALAYEAEWETRSALLWRLFFYLIFVLPLVLIVIPLILMLRQPIPREGWTFPQLLGVALHYLRIVSLPILIGLLALFLIGQAITATAWFQGLQQRLLLRLPVIGRVARATALDRYLATLGLLIRGGLPVAEAGEQAAQAAGNAALTPQLMQAAAAVREGVPLSQALESSGAFDRDTLHMAATGEVSGTLPEMLARAAGYYREEHSAKRRLLVRIGGIAFGVFWLIVIGALGIWGALSYFDFMFRGLDWMTQ
jgi:general secretion pathway protein F